MKSFLKHIKNFFIFYLLWGVLSVFGIIWEFNLLTRAKDEEKIDFFVCTELVDKRSFEIFVQENKPEYLKEVNFNHVDTNNFVFSQNISSYGDVEADIYIMDKAKFDLLPNEGKEYYLTPIDKTFSASYFGTNITYYENDSEIAYGIKLDASFFKEDVYLGFAKNSLHLGGLKDSALDGALSLAKKIIDYEN